MHFRHTSSALNDVQQSWLGTVLREADCQIKNRRHYADNVWW